MRAAFSTFEAALFKASKTCPEVLGWWRARSLAPKFYGSHAFRAFGGKNVAEGAPSTLQVI